jgi:cysteine desulfurase
MAMGLDENAARASLRFSLPKTTTNADVDRVLEVLPEVVAQLRALAPAGAAR